MDNNRHPPKKMTAAKIRAVHCLLECETVENAAKRAKVGRSSIYEWMQDEDFQARLQEGREALFYEGLDKLKGAMAKAADELIKLLSSDDEGQRRLAAKTILDFGLKGFELKNLEERILRLEAAIEDRTPLVS